jgi:hypothetical protein
LIIVAGTSLEVKGSVWRLIQRFDEQGSTKKVLINKQLLHQKRALQCSFDYTVLGDCDDIFRYIESRLDWAPEILSPSSSGDLTLSSNPRVEVGRKRKPVMKGDPVAGDSKKKRSKTRLNDLKSDLEISADAFLVSDPLSVNLGLRLKLVGPNIVEIE